MKSELRPRKEVTDNIRRSVRQLAAREQVREQKRTRWEPLRRLYAPLGYAAVGSVLTLVVMFGMVDVRSHGNSDPMQVTQNTASEASAAADHQPERPLLNREREDMPYVLPFASMAENPNAATDYGESYATGVDPQDGRLVSYIY
jgi:hypothetical protein